MQINLEESHVNWDILKDKGWSYNLVTFKTMIPTMADGLEFFLIALVNLVQEWSRFYSGDVAVFGTYVEDGIHAIALQKFIMKDDIGFRSGEYIHADHLAV